MKYLLLIFDYFILRIQVVQVIKPETITRFPFKHFYDQEVMEQPEALMKCLNNGARLAGERGFKLSLKSPISNLTLNRLHKTWRA